ncbi:DUF1294 domain-containing protein [Herbaspirillum sp. HC18]|nr:DUF1294 domain-containing protein [Herbaspirillum sp. HC18]
MSASFAAFFLAAFLVASLAGAAPLPLFAWYAAGSIAAFVAYGLDKSAARQSRRRIRERTLHALGLAGGWPGALIAQAVFRHKSRKQPFQLVFWITAFVNGAGLAVYFLARFGRLPSI